jgi:hypothetical protein
VVNDLIYNCERGIIQGPSGSPDDSCHNNLIAFNTVVQCTTIGLAVMTRSSTNPDTVRYNLCWSNTGGDLVRKGGTPVADYNFHGIGGLVGWVTEAHGDSGYPRFVDTVAAGGYDWSLHKGSPCLNFTNVDAAAAAVLGVGLDLAGNTRPAPAGSYADAGCYEEQTALPVYVDSVKYWACGTASAAGDSLIVWFSTNLEFDSLPLGAGNADHAFGLVGLGYMANATIDTPTGCPDTNFIFIEMNAGDTVLSHLRSRLTLVADSIYSQTGAAPCQPDTDSVRTWNVVNQRTGTAYQTILAGSNASVAGDTLRVMDNGYYIDTLRIARKTTFLNAPGRTPIVRYGGDTLLDMGASAMTVKFFHF